jgi:hypothetical protein
MKMRFMLKCGSLEKGAWVISWIHKGAFFNTTNGSSPGNEGCRIPSSYLHDAESSPLPIA